MEWNAGTLAGIIGWRIIMTEKKNITEKASELRKRAEQKAVQSPENTKSLSHEETQQVLHELRVHQIELEMQNEELRTSQAKLDAARTRYFDLYDLAPVGYLTISEQGVVLEANLTAATLFGEDRGLLSKRPFSQLVIDEDQDIYYLHRNQLLETKEPQLFELRMLKQDEGIFWANLAMTATKEVDGATVCRIVVSDITGHKKAEEALKRSQTLLAETERIGKVGGWEFNIDTEKQTWTEEIYRIHEVDFSYEPNVKNGVKFYTPASQSIIELAVREAIEQGKSYDLELEIITAKGNFRSVHAVGRADLEHRRVYGFFQDITERKKEEATLSRMAQEWQRTFDSMSEAVWILDKDQIVLRSNKAAEHYFHRPCEEMVGKHCWEIVHGTTQPIPECPAMRVRKSLRHESQELKIGEEWFDIAADPILNTEGQFNGVAHIVTNITARKNAEMEKALLELQLRESQKMEAVGQLAGGISHDFNNLLSIINGYSQMLLVSPDLKENLKQQTEEIQQAGERAAVLTRQLLLFSRHQHVEFRIIDLDAIISGMEKMLRRLIREDIIVNRKIGPSLWHIKADPGSIEQVIMNLVINATDAMPDGGKLTVETENVKVDETSRLGNHSDINPGLYVMLLISDTGCGMDDKVRKHIFEPFFTTKEVGKGTGLGLATVYGIVKQSNAHIDVQSELGKGTIFRIYFPKTVDEGVSNEKQKDAAIMPKGSETILLAEDEDSMRKMLQNFLQSLGYVVIPARNGKEALEIIEKRKGQINLLFTDIVMPGMKGFELAKQARNLSPEIKLLFMSGYDGKPADTDKTMQTSDDFIQKPLVLHTLSVKLREILDGKR